MQIQWYFESIILSYRLGLSAAWIITSLWQHFSIFIIKKIFKTGNRSLKGGSDRKLKQEIVRAV